MSLCFYLLLFNDRSRSFSYGLIMSILYMHWYIQLPFPVCTCTRNPHPLHHRYIASLLLYCNIATTKTTKKIFLSHKGHYGIGMVITFPPCLSHPRKGQCYLRNFPLKPCQIRLRGSTCMTNCRPRNNNDRFILKRRSTFSGVFLMQTKLFSCT